jgi:hypothetical protein
MRIFSISESRERIIYLYPFCLQDLHLLLPINSFCSIKMFIGYEGDKTYSVNKHLTSSELELLRNSITLKSLYKLISDLGIQPYEFELILNGINFKNFLGKSVLISTRLIKMNNLLKSLYLPPDILSLSNTLIDINQYGIVEKVGEFESLQNLFNYLYDEIYEFEYMKEDCPF